MKRFVLYIGTGLLSFVVGALAATLWNSHHSRPQPPAVIARRFEKEDPVEEGRPLTKAIVSRALQTRSFRTDKLRKNSNDEIVWRWLKEAIAQYPENWVKLNISDCETYSVMLYPLKELEPMELTHINRELNEKGLPSLAKGKRYLPIDVYQGNIICPSWSGFIDIEEAKLVYFVGESA